MSEEDWRNKILNKTMRDVLIDVEKMAKGKMWSRTFVAKCLLSWEQCLKALGADYDTIDTMTLELWEKYKFPDVSLVTDKNIINKLGEKLGREMLDEID